MKTLLLSALFLFFTNVQANIITLAWDESIDSTRKETEFYIIYKSTDYIQWTKIAVISSTVTNISISNLISNSWFYVTFLDENADESTASNIVYYNYNTGLLKTVIANGTIVNAHF